MNNSDQSSALRRFRSFSDEVELESEKDVQRILALAVDQKEKLKLLEEAATTRRQQINAAAARAHIEIDAEATARRKNISQSS